MVAPPAALTLGRHFLWEYNLDMGKLIVLRGPSGSGKSTIAEELRERCQGVDIAIVEQDYYKSVMLKNTSGDKRRNVVIEMTYQNTLSAIKGGYDVIVEGIFKAEHYREMFEKLVAEHPTENYFYYFDIGLDETLKRHQTRPKRGKFGEEDMRQWYVGQAMLGFPNEVVIGEQSSQQETIERIVAETGLGQ